MVSRLKLFRARFTDADDIPGIGQYEDFHTIDWQRDLARDRMRHRYIVKKIQDSVWDFIKVSVRNSEGSRHVTNNKKKTFHFLYAGSAWCMVGMAVCAAGRNRLRLCGWCDWHRRQLDDRFEAWHLSASVLAEPGAMLLVLQRDHIWQWQLFAGMLHDRRSE